MRRFVTPAVIALALGLMPQVAQVARGGWVTIKNDTDQPIQYREFSNGLLGMGILPKKLKDVRVLPGESYKVFQKLPGARDIEINDLKDPKPGCAAVPPLKYAIQWGAPDVTFVVRRTADPVKKTETWTLAELKPLPPGAPNPVQVAGAAAPAPAPAPPPPKPE